MLKCDSCKFFEATADIKEGLAIGFCHRYPPKDKFSGVRPSFASTRSDEWCGEHVFFGDGEGE